MESLSGVKAHTLRIWEKRYNIIKPKRTSTNIRYYTDDDLRNLLNVCYLYKNGHKISKIAKMSSEEIKSQVEQYSDISLNFNDEHDALMMFIYQFDSYNFNKVLDNHICQNGLMETMSQVIYPLLDKLSLAWLAGSFQAAHESFVTQIIKSKIQNSIEQLDEECHFKPTFLIYLPKAEKQELSLLYLHYLLKKNSCRVINLGVEVDLDDVILAMKSCSPDFVFTIINQAMYNISFQEYVNQLCSVNKKTRLIVTGYQVVSQNIAWPEQSLILKNLSDTINFIEELQA
ncbi:MAG: MerR family transcriptional regulator [Bacteroidia bacterium]|nr:MerR family transcriptional regulator [Bacteroidia bacterium]